MPKLSEITERAKVLPPTPPIDYAALPTLADYTREWVRRQGDILNESVRCLCALSSVAPTFPVPELPRPVPLPLPLVRVINIYVTIAPEED